MKKLPVGFWALVACLAIAGNAFCDVHIFYVIDNTHGVKGIYTINWNMIDRAGNQITGYRGFHLNVGDRVRQKEVFPNAHVEATGKLFATPDPNAKIDPAYPEYSHAHTNVDEPGWMGAERVYTFTITPSNTGTTGPGATGPGATSTTGVGTSNEAAATGPGTTTGTTGHGATTGSTGPGATGPGATSTTGVGTSNEAAATGPGTTTGTTGPGATGPGATSTTGVGTSNEAAATGPGGNH